MWGLMFNDLIFFRLFLEPMTRWDITEAIFYAKRKITFSFVVYCYFCSKLQKRFVHA